MQNQTKETFLYTPAIKKNNAVNLYLAFPGSYYLGMSSLGFLSNHYQIDKTEIAIPYRVFTDSPKTNISSDSLLGFSFSFELDFINIFKILESLKLPLIKSERDVNVPIIFAGGPVVTTNPEPFVDYFDFFIIGDGHKPLLEVLNVIYDNQHLSKEEKLELISKVEGIYIPENYEVTYNKDSTIKEITPVSPDISSYILKHTQKEIHDSLYTPILSDHTVFKDTYLIEVVRGCSQKCFFCLASYLNLPTRFPDKANIIETINNGLAYTRKIGLLGALITEHPDIEEILDYISSQHKIEPIKLTTSSLRADKLNAHIAKILSECNQKQVTISVEAGSERLRNSINKQLSNEDIIKCIDTCAKNNINSIKMYSMIGLPGETNKDVEELINLINNIRNQYKKLEIILSVNSFIPKAHTPFEREKFSSIDDLNLKMKHIKKELLKKAKVRTSSCKWDRIQAIISRGDRNLNQLLYKSFKHGSTLGSFNRSFKELSDTLNKQEWYTNRNIEKTEVLPWQHIKFH